MAIFGLGKKKDKKPKDEPTYSIQPAPAEPPQDGGGLQNDGSFAPFKAKQPYVPPQEQMDNLEQPLSREELRKRAAELNE
ncbi:hypothetical protein FRB99_005972 [Tulasnella sp. 403]|nr:hypothetical protein FRB99_005972 [Tulasnella sp. 403]